MLLMSFVYTELSKFVCASYYQLLLIVVFVAPRAFSMILVSLW
jgi:hypothetical protein